MSRLVDIFADAGFGDAWTYINSGNVVFDAAGARDEIEQTLESALEEAFGFEVTTFVRTAAELRKAAAASPFAVSDEDTYFLTFLKSTLPVPKRHTLENLSNDFDTLVVAGHTVHWRMHGKSTETRLRTKDWDAIVGRHRSTSRNMTMVRGLVRKIDA